MTTLEILAPYLPYGIEVVFDALNECPKRGRLHALDYHEYATAMLPGNSVASAVSLNDCLPVLYGFDDLPNVIVETPWGPALASVVLARMITGLQVMPENVRPFGNSLSAQDYSSGPFKMFLHASTMEKGNLMQSVVDYLRSKHFAVGLTAGQYIRKEVRRA